MESRPPMAAIGFTASRARRGKACQAAERADERRVGNPWGRKVAEACGVVPWGSQNMCLEGRRAVWAFLALATCSTTLRGLSGVSPTS